jgi:hypothetical protein
MLKSIQFHPYPNASTDVKEYLAITLQYHEGVLNEIYKGNQFLDIKRSLEASDVEDKRVLAMAMNDALNAMEERNMRAVTKFETSWSFHGNTKYCEVIWVENSESTVI